MAKPNKQNGDKNNTLQKIVLITAIINLIKAITDIIVKLID